jgi:hypothetical protein
MIIAKFAGCRRVVLDKSSVLLDVKVCEFLPYYTDLAFCKLATASYESYHNLIQVTSLCQLAFD